jgi:SAM-dependent methyltransferase
MKDWCPVGTSEQTALADLLTGLSSTDLISLLKESFCDRVATRLETSYPVTQSAYDTLKVSEVEKIESRARAIYGDDVSRDFDIWKEQNHAAYRRAILRYGCTIEPVLMKRRTGMTNANPPSDIHSMMRSEVFAGDLYSGDMIGSALLRTGFSFTDRCNYLDFGCSSGSLVRNMAAAFPNGSWHGCDPVEESIAWASAHFPKIALVRSEQTPPLPYPDGYFSGVYAVSIWSHFSERAALQWFDEMHRVIQPGGFLVLTAHGYRSLLHYLELGRVAGMGGSILSDLLVNQYAFRPRWDDPSQEYGLQVVEWGMAYFTEEWVASHLSYKFRLVDFQAGLNQSNQDVYVVARI